ncbi:MAG TPA: formate dehydrogenase accessory sulfurtransferase FdhD [Rubrivivax sp.]|nr:formate dehydrogenase accessory sulfurtransferase FdhD [Rubrivivax sp.]
MTAAALCMRPAPPLPSPSTGADEPLAPVVSVVVRRWQDGASAEGVDWACEEQPVSLEYNGVSHAVMMATPTALEDFALGFSLTEGIVGAPEEILDTEVRAHGRGLCVAMRVTARRAAALRERRRTLAGRSGCGLCGVDSLDHFDRMPAAVSATQRIDAAVLAQAMREMARTQPLRDLTGATHAAAWMDADGHLHALREDVGRHNALDKTVGALLRAGLAPAGGALLVTSRASYEMVQKAAAAGAGVLAAVSAPTALAIRTAQALGLTLVAFARGQRHVVYSHAWRLQAPGTAEGAGE